ncbi:hypothetical protein PICMEDRAFT_112974 [Pichia membranifaciens NRRL Y-2026]|uniref:CTLH/CRA C-terminal to LisH motif domain-containing protein n=1 Tax=Pichia membranifaciens NRRL Y-2026 TaxID=763406 RepID=A0A1E3NPF1_9ASCO|nr:hypothetical protein PICMEDRAFT_112974 [Pichia membranifaciens NRRL Y-2026]ODQ47423.1 hypothetical protein PICMEDRAFT_112974 [Pichia membranifaciens NRRL Y-2026]
MMNQILGELLNCENERSERDEGAESNNAIQNDNDNGDSSKSVHNGKNTHRRVSSTPIWPTELPDVFLFPDTFFQLQKDLNYGVLEYLIRMGYAGAADTFSKELQYEDKNIHNNVKQDDDFKGQDDKVVEDEDSNEFTEQSFDLQKEKMSQLFKTENLSAESNETLEKSKLSIKQQRATIGMESVYERKAMMIMLMNGQVKETIEFISRKWPHFFNEFRILKLRLLHLQAVEIIREFFDSDVSDFTGEELEEKEETFFNEFVEFIKKNLSDENILKSSRFIKDMELTMALISYGTFKEKESKVSFTERLPPELKKLVDISLRETIAVRVNKALLTYVDGVSFSDELDGGFDFSAASDSVASHEEEEDENEEKLCQEGSGYGVGDDDPNDPLLRAGYGDFRVLQRFSNGDSKLLQLVKLFVWSYKLNSNSNSRLSNRQKLEKMAEITLGQ